MRISNAGSRIGFLSLPALALAVLCWPSAAGAVEGGGQNVKRIGVVSVTRVFNAYKKVKKVQEDLKNEFEKENTELEARGGKLKEWATKIKVMAEAKPNDRATVQEANEFSMAEFDLKKAFQELAIRVEKRRMEEMRQVLREIRSAINAVTKEKQYDLILRAPEYDDDLEPVEGLDGAAADKDKDKEKEKSQAQSSGELVRRFRENPVLYFAAEIDITQNVIAKLNADYDAAPGKKAN